MPRKSKQRQSRNQGEQQFSRRTIDQKSYWECIYCGTCLPSKANPHSMEHCDKICNNMERIGNPRDAVYVRTNESGSYRCLPCNQAFNLGRLLNHFETVHASSCGQSSPSPSQQDLSGELSRLEQQNAQYRSAIAKLKNELVKTKAASKLAVDKKEKQLKTQAKSVQQQASQIKVLEGKIRQLELREGVMQAKVKKQNQQKSEEDDNKACQDLHRQLDAEKRALDAALAANQNFVRQNSTILNEQTVAINSCFLTVDEFIDACQQSMQKVDAMDQKVAKFLQRLNRVRDKAARHISFGEQKKADLRQQLDELRYRWSSVENCYEWTFERFLNYVCVEHPDLYGRNQKIFEEKWKVLPGAAMECINVPLIQMSGITGNDCHEIIQVVRRIVDRAEPGAETDESESDIESEKEGVVTGR